MPKNHTKFKAPTDGLIQMNISSAIENLKRMNDNKWRKKTKTITPISSNDRNMENNNGADIGEPQLAFNIWSSDDEGFEDKSGQDPNQTFHKKENQSTIANTSSGKNTSVEKNINIIQNISLPSNDSMMANTKKAVSSNIQQKDPKNKANISIRRTTASDKGLKSGYSKTNEIPSTSAKSPGPQSPKSPSSQSPKKEEKKMNPDFLKVMNGLISEVLNSTHLSFILSEQEKKIFKTIITSRQEYQYVCYKLYMLTWKWRNLFKFCEEIKCRLKEKEIIDLFQLMVQNDIIDTDWKKEDVTTLLNILPHSEVKDICSKMGILGKTKKDMMTNLMQHCNKQKTLPFCKSSKEIVLEKIMKKLGEYVVRIKDTYKNAFYNIFVLGTFTNSKLQDRNQYFRIMQESDFPEYTIQDHIVFYTRNDFENYTKACANREEFELLTVSKDREMMYHMGKDIINMLKNILSNDNDDDRFQEAPHLKRFTAVEVYKKLLTKICDALKKHHFDDVHEWLKYLIETFPKSHRLADWYYDLSIINETNWKNPEGAANVIIQALELKKEYLTETQIQQLGEKGRQLKKAKGVSQLNHDIIVKLLPVVADLDDFPQVTIDAPAIRGKPGRKRHYPVQNSDGSKEYKSVEQIALEYYERCGFPSGEHCEGSIILATFTLFFWDIIYNPDIVVPGTFLSRYQQFPLDMYSTYFYVHRKELIDKRLRDLAENWSDQHTLDFVTEHWIKYSHKSGLTNVANYIPNKEHLNSIVCCIGRKLLSGIYQRLVKDLGQYKSGMPDLLVWNEHDKKAKFIEVKGENDKLSVKQKLWLKYLISIGADVEVCQVHTIGSKKNLKTTIKNQSKIKNDDASFSKSCINSTPRKKKRCNSEDSISYFETPPSSPVPRKKKIVKRKSENNVTPSPKKIITISSRSGGITKKQIVAIDSSVFEKITIM
ncbi:fanconi-associated nuclease 1-like isoform X1 [Diorhabda sublineata]|uniref:fanconi-associated nuclease 1-like isoform X1 n=2 Tax=Diorhabda sublineata TaxID=1163346 RepID=UPI0024E0E17B|nr:fanconi-associated nuclease 1-like isoform X1 [Diorhabda sublineata]